MANTTARSRSDFSKGSVSGNILRLAGPMLVAQIINLLYNVIDRMYIGHLAEDSTNALTGVGVCFPILMMVTAFSNLYSTGGAPLFSMARGRGDEEHAAALMGTTASMLVYTALGLTAVGLLVKRPVLYMFGASDATFGYADAYISIYLLGTVFVMISLGLNPFITSQGFARTGMLTVAIGAVINIALDPVFIFVLGMGVRGAALATILSQFVSAAWVIRFLTGHTAVVRLEPKHLHVRLELLKEIVALGVTGFIMGFTNSAVQVVCNATLQTWGGDIYVAVMTVLNSIREIAQLTGHCVSEAGKPVNSFNYGAGEYKRVRQGIKFVSIASLSLGLAIWLTLLIFPKPFIRIFSSNPDLITYGVPAMQVYFFGFFMMFFQFVGQSVFVSLGRSKQAVFFSIFRKIVIVVPLTLLLPNVAGLGVMGVFMAEPISNWIGGGACYITMMLTVWRQLKDKQPAE